MLFKLLLSLLTGVIVTLGYAPFSLWWVVPVGFSGFLYILTRCQTQNGFICGFAFGLGWFGAGISWVHVSIADFGGLPLIGSLGLMLLLCSYLALYPALASWLIRRWFTPRLWPLILPLVWLLTESLRGWLFTGFPWLSLGYSQLDGPLNGWFAVIGDTGVTVLLVLICSTLACWLPARQYAATAVIVVVLLLSGLLLKQHSWVTPTGEQVKIAMVQGNIQQSMRWVPENDAPTMEKYRSMTNPHWDADVVIWPEAAIPKLEPTAIDFLHQMDIQAINHQAGFITGIVNYNFETNEAFNNLLALGLKYQPDIPSEEADLTRPQGQYYYPHGNRYAKHHLLPIGEFIPFEDWLRGLAPIFDLPMSSFSRGAYQQANLEAKGYFFAPAICFEIAFPGQIAANLYEHTNFIITVSNDAWFGHSHGPAQHLEIARVRAKEFGLPVLRATNNGITAFIDYQGRIQSRLPQFEAAVLSDDIALVSGKTPYRVLGNWPIWLFCLLSCAVCVYFRRG